MKPSIKKIFVNGFPSLYGGAGTELHHQILIWLKMGVEVHIIPTHMGYENEALYAEMLSRGVIVHAANDWTCLEEGDPIIGFCNAEFLENLAEIHQHTKRTIFVNCMTWLFEKEKECMQRGLISLFLYQNEEVQRHHQPLLQALNPAAKEVRFMRFVPYFNLESFPYISQRDEDFFGCGRISRQDADKFASNTLQIYENFHSPRDKRGLFLGFSDSSRAKIGEPMDWIRTATDQNELSQQDFYRHCRIILQPSDTTENWPRIGFEAMASGSVLIVDNRGGWRQLIEHGKTGWLCDQESDFIHYASLMAREPQLCADMALAAYNRGLHLGGEAASMASWEEVFDIISQLPISS